MSTDKSLTQLGARIYTLNFFPRHNIYSEKRISRENIISTAHSLPNLTAITSKLEVLSAERGIHSRKRAGNIHGTFDFRLFPIGHKASGLVYS